MLAKSLPLHGGRILGMPGRIVIWWRKRRSRMMAQKNCPPEPRRPAFVRSYFDSKLFNIRTGKLRY
jgi:hypothetical protein